MCERIQIPKKKEIAEIPVLAMIAFAARCARRVQPLFVASWTDAPKNHIRAIEYAISLAEETAKSGKQKQLGQIGTDANTAAQDATVKGNDIAAYAAYSAEYALAAATSFPLIAANYIAEQAAKAACATDKAAKAHSSKDSSYKIFLTAVWRDFDKLKNETQGKGQWYNPPISPDFFGGLWPEGRPSGWPS